MLTTLISFELRFWLRGFMVYIFLLTVALLVFGAMTSEHVIIGSALENTYKNAPFVIQNFYSFMSPITLLMTTAFVNSAATRDFSHDTQQIIFTTPLKKFDYLMGRFVGATIVAMIPMFGVSLGAIVARLAPWNDSVQWGPLVASAHINSILVFVIPNTLLVATIIFAIATLTRSTIASFIGGLLLLVGFVIAGALTRDIENETLAMLLDPFGIRAFALTTKYWTIADKNTRTVGLSGMLLINRVLWVTIGLMVLGLAYFRFTFAEKTRKARRIEQEEVAEIKSSILPAARFNFDIRAQLSQFFTQAKVDFRGIIRSTVFIVLMVAALLNMLPQLFLSVTGFFGIPSLPVTYAIIDIIRGSLYVFLIATITFYAGVLIWKERDAKMDEIYDALPHPTLVIYTSKLASLIGLVAIILLLSIAAGVLVQAIHGYTNFQLGLYFRELLVIDLSGFIYLIVFAMFIHTLSPNKYIGYFAFIILVILNTFIWGAFDIVSNMVKFAAVPGYTYSDLFGFAPYSRGLIWFNLYWALFCCLLSVIALLLWQRGRETTLRHKARSLWSNFNGPVRWIALAFLALWIAAGAWVFYNTRVLNKVVSPERAKALAVEYEKTYKQFNNTPQPRITDVKYDIAIYPEERNLVLKGEQRLVNKTDKPIEEIHLSLANNFENEIEIEHAQLEKDDAKLNYRIYRVLPPLAPMESLKMTYTVKSLNKGFENEVSNIRVAQNGTFFNSDIVPEIGYQTGKELSDKNDRRKFGLPERERMPELERDCSEDCLNTYVSNNSDWVNVETVISTSPDQIAIAPGSLEQEWQQDGRRYFRYRLDHPSLNVYSFMSARYKVAREEWNGIGVEVYYHPGHEYNVPKMLSSIHKSLEYCTTNFGPYRHKQARIIEFPRVAQFAQAFPGTMPYSEGIGFIADLTDPEDIDFVFYVVAHEMGHQWWAHQIIGANMQGATSLSETLAQYTALMVMEKEYGREIMRKFLKYEMDKYLSSRGRETAKEQPLLRVEASQGYVHYQKGSVVMYYIKEMIGEDAVNRALRHLIEQYGYKEPPYPTSYQLLEALKRETPENLQYIYKELFEEITLYGNRTTDAAFKRRDDGKFDVTITVESRKFKADEKGAETEVDVNDWIEIGAFAKPEDGKRYGKTLYRERMRMNTGTHTYTFTVDEAPDKAGIDPFALLVDRVPDDNLRTVHE